MEGVDDELLDTANAGGLDALAQVGIEESPEIVDVLNERAVEYARDRSAEMVGKKWVDGELIDNPDDDWVIDEATRDMLRATVTEGIEEGWSTDRLADEIAGHYAFSDERAAMIARTETRYADVAGSLSAYKASGVVSGKEWLTADGCCDECGDLDGVVVGLDDDFPGDGSDGPPLHPNCECSVLPVLDDSEGD